MNSLFEPAGVYVAHPQQASAAVRGSEEQLGLRCRRPYFGVPIASLARRTKLSATASATLAAAFVIAIDGVLTTPRDEPVSDLSVAQSAQVERYELGLFGLDAAQSDPSESLVRRLRESVSHPGFAFRRGDSDPGLLSWIAQDKRLHVSLDDPLELSRYWTLVRRSDTLEISEEVEIGSDPVEVLRTALRRLASA